MKCVTDNFLVKNTSRNSLNFVRSKVFDALKKLKALAFLINNCFATLHMTFQPNTMMISLEII